MKAIAQSILDRSQIKCTLYNTKKVFKDIRSLEKMRDTPELGCSPKLCNDKIKSLINDAVNELHEIEPLCKLYHELFMEEFTRLKNQLHKITLKQPLT